VGKSQAEEVKDDTWMDVGHQHSLKMTVYQAQLYLKHGGPRIPSKSGQEPQEVSCFFRLVDCLRSDVTLIRTEIMLIGANSILYAR
jgi:hypothetical protein